MMASIIHQSRAPGLVLGEVGHVPNASVVRDAIESEGENARQVGGRTAYCSAHLIILGFCKTSNFKIKIEKIFSFL